MKPDDLTDLAATLSLKMQRRDKLTDLLDESRVTASVELVVAWSGHKNVTFSLPPSATYDLIRDELCRLEAGIKESTAALVGLLAGVHIPLEEEVIDATP